MHDSTIDIPLTTQHANVYGFSVYIYIFGIKYLIYKKVELGFGSVKYYSYVSTVDVGMFPRLLKP